ncbi:flagellar biosynthesis protein FlhF [Thermoanaerobacteraceae bacterium SP2]|jgi:flagellar biosynthesis protein FlhF|nr:flagellar biosynthesis protein FlhF [Thermoanaerobacteraceae bacterium SP2]
MKIKTYVANNMQEALYKIKSDLGKDAIILQTKHIRKGGILGFFSRSMVEVVAANDLAVTQTPSKKAYTNTRIHETVPPIQPTGSIEFQDIKNALGEVKDMIKNLYSNHLQKSLVSEWGFSPVFEMFYKKMMAMEINEELINSIFSKVSQALKPEELKNENVLFTTIKNELISQIGKIEPIHLSEDKNVIVAFIGPTGVGKTTTIAKLAAKFTLYHGKKVAMITADTFRVGAIEQLKTYGELLEIPVEVIYGNDDIKTALNRVKGYDLVLIDTMGSSPNNKMQIKKVKSLLDAVNPTDIYMVISATTKSRDIGDILNNYKELNFNKLIITKLDETRTYGTIMNAVKMTDSNLSYFTVGQNVPDDIEIASAEKLASMILGENTYV